MTDLVDFEQVKYELADVQALHVMSALGRKSRWFAKDHVPHVLIATDRDIFYGGTEATKNMFHRIPLDDVKEVKISGRGAFRCIEVKYVCEDDLECVYLVPFEGSLHMPLIHEDNMNTLYEHLKEVMQAEGRIDERPDEPAP